MQPGTISTIPGVTAAELYIIDTDTLVDTADTVVPGTADPTHYVIAFSDVAVGEYRLVLKAGSIIAGVEPKVTLTTNGWSVSIPQSTDYSPRLAAIQSLISSGNVTWIAPVLETGQLSGPIIIGDDFMSSLNRSFDWIVDPLPFPVTQATCLFGGKSQSKPPGWNIAGAVTEVSGDQPKWRLRFELPREVTSLLKAGLYNWSAEVRGPAGHSTRVMGSVNVVPKQTI